MSEPIQNNLLETYRSYLWTLAHAQLGVQLGGQLDASDVVQLPVEQRDVVIQKHLRNRTLQEIADETHRTVPAVAGLLRRGLATLRDIMDNLSDQH